MSAGLPNHYVEKDCGGRADTTSLIAPRLAERGGRTFICMYILYDMRQDRKVCLPTSPQHICLLVASVIAPWLSSACDSVIPEEGREGEERERDRQRDREKGRVEYRQTSWMQPCTFYNLLILPFSIVPKLRFLRD